MDKLSGHKNVLRVLWLYSPVGFSLLILRMVWFNEILKQTQIDTPKGIAQVEKLHKDIALFNHAFKGEKQD